ncbi:MAG: DUF1847 domain-containing protein [Bacillota bacterium]|nr:DUF1847 domain-containing protein [Bacillota bacterium]
MDNKDIKRSCIDCAVKSCDAKGGGMYPEFCETANMDPEFLAETMKLYTESEENTKIMMAASEVEFENYCKMTRVEEICEFAAKIGAKKLGIATCVGLLWEARMAAKIFRSHGFEVVGAACKIGAQPKVSVGISKEHESVGVNMCNPIMQAEVLNKEETDLNVVVGLCVGHDSLFYKHSDALCTTLVTKDRVLAHNPAAALYQADKYYSRLVK